jgi:hypothetical protein
MKFDKWTNCYPSSWKGVITPESMAHPAKYSSRLIRRIYQHLVAEGWVRAGDRVVDPFGGVALGALDAMRMGLHWYGCELEPRFAELGNKNIELWNSKYGNMPRWGSAHLMNGDSRHLVEILEQHGVSVAVSSPPYADSIKNESGIDPEKFQKPAGQYSQAVVLPYGETPGQLGAMKAGGFEAAISSPPFLQSEGGASSEPKPGGAIDHALRVRHAAGNKSSHAYGESDGQLSSMKDGGFDVAISSPPFMDNNVNIGAVGNTPGMRQQINNSAKRDNSYGVTDGQLGNMTGYFDASISSPPYDEARVGTESGQEHCGHGDQYGEAPGQLGGSDDFWLAARAIVEQVYQALEPGGHAAWVTKRYVKGGKIVEFSQQWAQLCEAVGFRVVCWHHAMLVHHKGAQHTLDGDLIQKTSESKSFFRRLAEKNGSPKIDWEDVICMVKE